LEDRVNKVTTAASALTGAVGAAWLATRPLARSIVSTVGRTAGNGPGHQWLKVTISCPPEQLTPHASQLPEPIARLNGRVEVSVAPAPGDRGTELGLRLVEPPPAGMAGMLARLRGGDPRQELRSALRDTKSLIETGEVIRPDEPPTTHPTPTGKLLDLALSRAGGEGRL
jgi:hypothetical protein